MRVLKERSESSGETVPESPKQVSLQNFNFPIPGAITVLVYRDPGQRNHMVKFYLVTVIALFSTNLNIPRIMCKEKNELVGVFQ